MTTNEEKVRAELAAIEFLDWFIQTQEQAAFTTTRLQQARVIRRELAAHRTASTAAPGLSFAQEPKYTVNGSAIVNRASGEAIPADEPVFIFRARDRKALRALTVYGAAVALGSFEHWDAVSERIADFSRFAAAHPERMKEPDTHPASPASASPEPVRLSIKQSERESLSSDAINTIQRGAEELSRLDTSPTCGVCGRPHRIGTPCVSASASTEGAASNWKCFDGRECPTLADCKEFDFCGREPAALAPSGKPADEPSAWMDAEGRVLSREQMNNARNHQGGPGLKIAETYSIPLYATSGKLPASRVLPGMWEEADLIGGATDCVPTKGTTAIVEAWNALPDKLRLDPHLVRLFDAVKTCRDIE